MNRRSFVGRAAAGALGMAIGRWPAWWAKARTFPGRLRRLGDTNWKEPGPWLG